MGRAVGVSLFVGTATTLLFAALRNTLQCILSESGFADEPLGGCPPQTPSCATPAEVGRIVEGVIAELKRRGIA